MTLLITVNVETDGEESWKEATCSIDGIKLNEEYSYDISTTDETIESEVEADLTTKGYTW